MKLQVKVWMAGAMLAGMLISSCSKEIKPDTENPQSAERALQEAAVLSEQADREFLGFAISGGSENESFYMENDGMPEAYLISGQSADETGLNQRTRPAGRFRACLSGLEADPEQRMKIRRLLLAYTDCKSDVQERYILALRTLTARFLMKHHDLRLALQNGRIDRDVFIKRIKALRTEFASSRQELAAKAAPAMKNCYTQMLRGLQGILSERQWKAFVNCYRP